LIPRGGKVGDVAEHLANNAGKLMLEREAAKPKPKAKTTANNSSGAQAKKPANKQAANKQTANKQIANNSNKPKSKPQADSKVAANEKKAN
jgi:hypothetical protein